MEVRRCMLVSQITYIIQNVLYVPSLVQNYQEDTLLSIFPENIEHDQDP